MAIIGHGKPTEIFEKKMANSTATGKSSKSSTPTFFEKKQQKKYTFSKMK